MSTHQAQRAGIREGNGNGSTSTSGRAVNASNPSMPSLEPSSTDIVTLLKSQKIVKKDEKYALFKSVYERKTAFTAFLAELSPGASDEFVGLDCFKQAIKQKTGYTADVLGQYLFDIRNALRLILPRSQHHFALSESMKRVVISVSVRYEQARHTATTELQSKFSSQFVSVNADEADRKYLENGYKSVPGSGLGDCICCGHGYTDEPNSNIAAGQDNTNKRAAHEAEIASDEQTWADGGTVYQPWNCHAERAQAQRSSVQGFDYQLPLRAVWV